MAVFAEEGGLSGLRLVRGSEPAVWGLAPGIWAGGERPGPRAAVRFSSGADFSGEAFLELCQVEMALRLPFNNRAIRGFAALGQEKSGVRYASGSMLGVLVPHSCRADPPSGTDQASRKS